MRAVAMKVDWRLDLWSCVQGSTDKAEVSVEDDDEVALRWEMMMRWP